MYIAGLLADPDVPFSTGEDEPEQDSAPGPRHRTVAAAGGGVIDISAMIADLEANQAARRRR